MSVDPLTGSYPELTPFQFASNRPIDGIDLDGLEYLNFNVSTVRLAKGQALIKIENLSFTTQEIVSKFNSDTRFWEGNVGVNTSVKSYDTETNINGQNLPVMENKIENFELENNYKIRIGIPKNRFGIEDKRYKERFVENNPASKPIGRRSYRTVAFMEVAQMIYTETQKHNWASDKSKIRQHVQLGEKAMNDVNAAFEEGLIKIQYPKFMDYPGLEGMRDNYITNTLYKISSYVLQGDDGGDKSIKDLGRIVWDEVSEK